MSTSNVELVDSGIAFSYGWVSFLLKNDVEDICAVLGWQYDWKGGNTGAEGALEEPRTPSLPHREKLSWFIIKRRILAGDRYVSLKASHEKVLRRRFQGIFLMSAPKPTLIYIFRLHSGSLSIC